MKYTIEKILNNIYVVTFVTEEKWPTFDVLNETTFDINGKVVKIEDFLPKDSNIIWITSVMQSKDLVKVYYIPDSKEIRQSTEILKTGNI